MANRQTLKRTCGLKLVTPSEKFACSIHGPLLYVRFTANREMLATGRMLSAAQRTASSRHSDDTRPSEGIPKSTVNRHIRQGRHSVPNMTSVNTLNVDVWGGSFTVTLMV